MGEMLGNIQPIDAIVPPDLETQAIPTSAPFFSANFNSLELSRPEQQGIATDENRNALLTSGGGAVDPSEFLASLGGFSDNNIHQQTEKHPSITTPTTKYISSLHDTDHPPYSIQDTTIMEASGNLFASAHGLTRVLANRRYASVGEPQERFAHFDGGQMPHDTDGDAGGRHGSGADSISDDFGVDGLSCSGVEAIFEDFVNSESGGEVVNIDSSDDTSP